VTMVRSTLSSTISESMGIAIHNKCAHLNLT
jgi:hypothetical protein